MRIIGESYQNHTRLAKDSPKTPQRLTNDSPISDIIDIVDINDIIDIIDIIDINDKNVKECQR